MRLWEADDMGFGDLGSDDSLGDVGVGGGGVDANGNPIPTHQTILNSLNSMKLIDNIDKSLKSVYEDVISNNGSFSSVANKVQRFEIEDFSKSIQQIRTSNGLTTNANITKEEDQTREFLNTSSSNLLGNFNDFIISGDRKDRYQIYDEIPDLNYIAFRMQDVYIQNIFVKNIQTKRFLFIGDNPNMVFRDEQTQIKKHYENLLKTMFSYYELENKLKNFIIPKTLKYGNYFMEIVNFSNLENFINTSKLLQESSFPEKLKKEHAYYKDLFEFEAIGFNVDGGDEPMLLENAFVGMNGGAVTETDFSLKLKSFLKTNQPKVLLEENNIFSFLNDQYRTDNNANPEDEDYNFEDLEDLDIDKLKDIQLRGIDPSKVIIVEDESILYGYIIIEDNGTSKESNEIDVYKRFLSDGKTNATKDGRENTKEAIDKMTKFITDNILEIIRVSRSKTMNKNFNFDELKLPDDSLYSIKSILYNKIKEKSKLKFRFLSSNHLVNFSAPINKYAPYGTSIFDPIVQPVKLYTLALISSIISRLSRASVVRKWNIEAGSKKNHAEIVESVKKDLKNKSISFDNLSNIKNISNVLTDFRDIATIKIDGQSFIDMEILPMGDRSLPLNDANDLKADLVAATGVPSIFLGLADQADMREQLVNMNTGFANNILNWQSNIEEGINRLQSIIFTELLKANGKSKNTFNISSYLETKLTPPLVLQVQSNEALITSITNIIGLLKSSGMMINPKQLYELFIPTLDWDSLEDGGKKYVIEQAKDNLIQPDGNMAPSQ
jgi:hypothetical protein